MEGASDSKKTPLHEEHVAAGARMAQFAGYQMPIQYTSVIEEHEAVRTRAGLFDVSHMGEIVVRGPRALEFVQLVSCNDHSKLRVGRAQYTGLMYPEATFVDDVLVHRLDDDEYLMVVNAANVEKDFTHLTSLAEAEQGIEVENCSDQFAQLALQGPLAPDILQSVTQVDLGEIKYYRFTRGEVAGHRALVARTGYTGEDGFEVYVSPEDVGYVWRAIVDSGISSGLRLAGLGARDTLRLEAGMALYGNEIDDTTTPYEAGLDWIVKLDKGDFIGRDELERQRAEGVERRLVGFEMVDRGIARHDYRLFLDGKLEKPVGHVTSGTQLPTFGKAMGMAYLPVNATAVDQLFFVDIRGRAARARVVELPFYSRKKK